MQPPYPLSPNLSDALPLVETAVRSQPSLTSTLVSASAVLTELTLETASLSPQATFRDLARFFRTHATAIGVLITNDAQPTQGPPVGMISRQRFLAWRSHRAHWRQVLDRPLSHIHFWWQEAQTYVLIDPHRPLTDIMALLLEHPAHEPLVVQAPDRTGIADSHPFYVAYTRLVRAEQTTLADPTLENLWRQHQLILNAIGEGVYGVDIHGRATFINPAAAQMIGWNVQDLIGKSMHQVLHHSHKDHSPYPREECPIYAAFQDGIVHRVADEVFWRQDGTCFPVEYISTPMRDEQGRLIGAVVAFRDITQRKWAEAVLHRTNEDLEYIVRERTVELRQANEQLKELNEVRSRVVSMVCHEFRNPLNNILLAVSSLGRYDAQLSSEQKEKYLLDINDNVERMTQMIDAILIIGKVEAKGMAIQKSTFDAIQFCRDVIAEMQPETQSARIKFISRIKQLPITVDKRLLRSIITNILSNSIRYSPGPSLVHLKVSKQKQQVMFQIADQGIGIPAEDLPYLFEPFHRGRNVSNIPGTGLGLNIVKRFVDLHQGKIEVESTLGKGTTFTVILPT